MTFVAVVSTAFGQNFGPMIGGPTPGPIYGEPTTEPVYSPQGLQAAFNPAQTGVVPTQYTMPVPPANGMPQPGAMQPLDFSQSLGDYGTSYQEVPSTWGHVRDLQMGVYTNDEQTVFNGGSTIEFYVNDRWGFAGRLLGGGTNNMSIKDRYDFTGEIYGGNTFLGNHWFKFGWLWDTQSNFSKTGPAWGALFWTDHKHPISLDIAYGLGYGDPQLGTNLSTVRVADDDLQLRAGTYLTPNLQAGFSGNWLNWADGQFKDYNAYGGFIAWNYGDLAINVDYVYGNDEARAFANVAYTFGGRRPRPTDTSGAPLVVEHRRDWITKPVMRNVSLQLQKQP